MSENCSFIPDIRIRGGRACRRSVRSTVVDALMVRCRVAANLADRPCGDVCRITRAPSLTITGTTRSL